MEVRSVNNNQQAFGANTASVKVADKNTWSICSIGQSAKEEPKKADSKKTDEPSCWSKLVKSVTDFFNNIIAWFKDKLCCCCGDDTFFKVEDGKKGEKLLKTLSHETEKYTFTLGEGDNEGEIIVEGDMKKMPAKGHEHFVKVVADLLKANKDHSVEVPVDAPKELVALLEKQFEKADESDGDTHLSFTAKVEVKKDVKKVDDKKGKEEAPAS